MLEDLNVLFAKNTYDLSTAQWSQVNRAEYLEFVKQRKAQCAAYSHVNINVVRADAEVPAAGVPAALQTALQEIEGSENAPIQLSGPASRAPENGPEAEAGDA